MHDRLFVVIGTRPEAIKLAPLADALHALGLQPTLIFTGQHPGLNPADYALGHHPCHALDCPGQDDPHAHAGAVTKAMVASIAGAKLLIVQGDTSSALGGALAGKVAGVPVAHVEAGLRSHDRRRPWPEEEFRVAIDRQSELLFAPTELSASNLRRERVPGRVHVTGNTGIDAVLRLQRTLDVPPRPREIPRLLVTCHRRENWQSPLCAIGEALREIASTRLVHVEVLLHPNPALAAKTRDLLESAPGISFSPPASHREAVGTMLRADLILSDSGGLQEEAAALGIPLLILRERTERPEAIASGNTVLVGTETSKIVEAVRRRLDRPASIRPTLPFGDGRASERIAAIIEEWLAERAPRG